MAIASVARGESYIVLYRAQGVPANAATTIQKAGGTLLYSYNQIGVAIRTSVAAPAPDRRRSSRFVRM